jgi:O-antigen/teichoic acid export membrane protein
MFGFGTMLIAELAASPERTRDLLPASLAATAVLSFTLAIAFVIGASVTGSALAGAMRSPLHVALFVIGVVLSAVTAVFDQASVGLSIAHVQLWRNTWFSAAKIAAIPLIVIFGGNSSTILLTWVLGLALSILFVLPNLRRRNVLLFRRPRFAALSGLGWTTFHHNVLNLSLSIPRMAIPVVVGLFQPGAVAAAFYAAWMIAGFLYSVPTHLSTSLFAIAAGDLRALRLKTRTTLKISVAFGVLAVPSAAVFAPQIMLIFGSEYAAIGGACLVVLTLAYPCQVVKQHYAAVLRVNGRVRRAALVGGLAAAGELTAVVLGSAYGDLILIASLQGIILAIEMVLMAPRVLQALRSQSIQERKCSTGSLNP